MSELKWHSPEETYNPRDIRLFVDRWRSDIIITTTVRLCETILGPSKRDSIRLNRLARSIILIDEVQSFPVKYWDIIGETIRTLTENLGCYVLLATATMPAIISPKDMYSTIVDGKDVNRYQVEYKSTRIPLDGFIREVIDELRENPESNILVVLNTKASATLAYSEIVGKIGQNDAIFFLSGWVAPIHRKETIKLLREALRERTSRVVLVCTQVIEAGVDVSFDIAFRDLAPLDSIIQVAGRCNRSWENEQTGTVKVRCVFDPETDRGYAQSVYDEVDLEMTREFLHERDGLLYYEEELREKLNQFFTEIRERKITNKALRHALRLEWEDLGNQFNLIEKPTTTHKLFIRYDERTESILSKIRKGLKEGRLGIPAQFYRYSLELSEKQFDQLGGVIEKVHNDDGRILFGVLDTETYTKFYSPEKGLQLS